MTYPAKNISISINAPKDKVYQYASNPENFPEWIGFIKTISKKADAVWLAETDIGTIEIGCAPENEFGIIDHIVTLSDGTKVNNPLRIIENEKEAKWYLLYTKCLIKP